MNYLEVIKARRSHRIYQNRMISEDDLRTIISCGLSAPFGGPPKPKCQVTEFIIVTDEKVKGDLALNYEDRQFIKEAPLILACCANTKNDPDYREWVLSVSLSIQNVIIAAEFLGIGSCFLSCFLNHEHHFKDKEELRSALGLPQNIELIGIIAMGYKDNSEILPEKIMRDEQEILSLNHYGNLFE